MIGSNTRDYKPRHAATSLYRRSMYTFWKRAAPPASMDIFNAPSREVCTVRRERTEHAAAGAGDAERSAVRRGRPASGRADAARRAATTDERGSTSSPGGCWPGRSGPRKRRSSRRRSPTCSAYYQAPPRRRQAADRRRRDRSPTPALDPPTAGRLDDAGQRADEPGRSLEQVDVMRTVRERVRPYERREADHATQVCHEPVRRLRPDRDAPAVLRPRGERRWAWRRWPRCSGGELPAARRKARRRLSTALPRRRTSPPRPSRSSICTWSAARRRWTCTTTSRRWTNGTTRTCPTRSAMGQRLTTMTSGQKRFPIAPSKYKFAQHGKSGMWVSELLPYTAKMVDDMCFIRSMHTEAINHEPAITYMQTGNQVTGRPCLGSWVSYGLGSLNENLPTFVVLVAKPTEHRAGAGDLGPALVVGLPAGRARRRLVPHRRRPDPVHQQPARRAAARSAAARSTACKALNEMNYQAGGRPRDAHPHPAIRAGLPHAVERARADRHRRTSPRRPTSSTATRPRSPARFAHTALLARRMVERGVRFVQIYHNNWDTHGNVAGRLPDQCRDVDQPC